MIRKVGALLLTCCIVLAAQAAHSQERELQQGADGFSMCGISVYQTRPIFLFRWRDTIEKQPGNFNGKPGLFAARSGQLFGLFSEPGSNIPTREFIALDPPEIEFFANDTDKPALVDGGILWELPPQELLDCADKEEWRDGSRREGADESEPPASLIGDLIKKSLSNSNLEPPKRLGELVAGVNSAPPSAEPPPAVAGSREFTANEAGKPVNPPASKPDAKTPKPAPPRKEKLGDICNASDPLRPVSLAPGFKPIPLQTVGMRNAEERAEAYDFVAGEAFSRNVTLSIAESAGKLVPYEAIEQQRAGNLQWVAIPGLLEIAKRQGSVRPISRMRIVVVSGAPELSISGLDLVGDQLERQSGGALKVEGLWYPVDENGALAPPEDFHSLQELVKFAAQKAGEQPSDVLDEAQLLSLFDRFEAMLKAQRTPADKIFWIKGAFSLPSSFPARLEKFIANVSSSQAVARNAAGELGKWLIIVTARIKGFTNNYLRAPIYDLNAGEVIEEKADKSGDRRTLIGDAVVLAAKLKSGFMPAPPPPPLPDADQKPVFSDRQVFAQHGYLFTPEAAAKLSNHLRQVSSLWSGDRLDSEVLKKFTEKAGKPNPSLRNVLETFDGETYPRLPKTLPKWARMLLKELNTEQSREAMKLVKNYAEGAEKLAAMLKSSPRAPACTLYYVSEEFLMLSSQSRTAEGATDAP